MFQRYLREGFNARGLRILIPLRLMQRPLALWAKPANLHAKGNIFALSPFQLANEAQTIAPSRVNGAAVGPQTAAAYVDIRIPRGDRVRGILAGARALQTRALSGHSTSISTRIK